MANENDDIGGLVAKWRKNAGLSQVTLAEAVGTQQATISKLESGVYKMSVIQLLSILTACGLKLHQVAGEIEAVTEIDGRPLWERIDE